MPPSVSPQVSSSLRLSSLLPPSTLLFLALTSSCLAVASVLPTQPNLASTFGQPLLWGFITWTDFLSLSESHIVPLALPQPQPSADERMSLCARVCMFMCARCLSVCGEGQRTASRVIPLALSTIVLYCVFTLWTLGLLLHQVIK